MKKAVFGLHLVGLTALSVRARAGIARNAALTVSARLGTGQRIAGTGEWKVELPAGDHIVQLDGDIDGAIDITLNPPAVIVSLAGPTSNALTSWLGGGATTSDVKDPWPPPIVAGPNGPTAVAALAGADAATWFNTVLAPMANTIGRGSVESPPIHALVIGIDDYPPAEPPNRTLFNSLGGCVRDALEVVAFLRDRLGVPPSQITQLLAPLPGVAAPRTAPPTYDNIVAAWQRLIDEVPRGEQIYIHYSGHGGRVKTCLPEIKGATARDEALAPCDVNQRDTGRFLRDVEIARLLERMAERGLIGTIVVDACHSGGLPRGRAIPRCGTADDLDPRKSDALGSAVGTRAELEATAQRGAGSRGVGDAWSFAPSSTVVVAACRQNEFAYEYAFDGHTRRGALTYFWLDALDRRGASLTYGAATRRIDAEITAHGLAQRPMAIGDASREILGLDHVRPARAIPVLAVAGDRVTLAAGMAALIRRGMRLAIAPPEAADNAIELAGLPEVEVTDVDANSSIARRVGDNPGEIVGGAQAIPLRYTDSITRFVTWLPSGLAGDDDARRAFADALAADRSNLVAPAPDGVAAQYTVTVTTAGGAPAYRIDDAGGVPVPNLGAAIGVGDGGAARVVARLAHLARYGTVQTLDNSDSRSPLTGCLELELLALPGDYQEGDRIVARPFAAGQPDRLLHNTWFCMRLRNRSPFELHAVVLDLQADWGISKAVPSNMPWIQLAPDGFHDTAIRAWVPDGQDTISDTLKAIATMEPTAFDWLCLDAIDQIDNPNRARKGMQSDSLGLAMEAMRSTTRSTRNVSEANVPTRAWTTVQRVITVEAEARRDKGAA